MASSKIPMTHDTWQLVGEAINNSPSTSLTQSITISESAGYTEILLVCCNSAEGLLTSTVCPFGRYVNEKSILAYYNTGYIAELLKTASNTASLIARENVHAYVYAR